MDPQKIGFLHPGAMGSSIAASAQNSGHQVFWASQERSAASHARAAKIGMHDVQTLANLCAECAIVVSVCPPHAAEAVARQVIDAGFHGLYLDANAIAPQRAIALSQIMAESGVSFVDGGIIGGPAWQPNSTWLYLSGPRAADLAACFASGPLETQVLGAEISAASALKMCYAAYTKGTTALLSAILATADQLGVDAALAQQWDRDAAGSAASMRQRVRGATAKAWRFSGEMEEIAATFQAAGLPGEFHLAAAEIYRRMAHFKDAAETPELAAILAALAHPQTPSEPV